MTSLPPIASCSSNGLGMLAGAAVTNVALNLLLIPTHGARGAAIATLVAYGVRVVGGLLPLSWTTVRAFRGAYGAERSTGVLLCAMYWHFLDGVWLVIFGLLEFS